jgi:hypothetical protein
VFWVLFSVLAVMLRLAPAASCYDTKQDDSDGYYGYDVNEKVVKINPPWV